MFQKNPKQFKVSQKKSKLDQVLWFVENYLPKKKHRANRKELRQDTLKAETIKQIQRFAPRRSKLLTPKQRNNKVSFTVGTWALPYLNLLKRTGLLK